MKLGEGQETWGDMGKEAREGIQSQGKIESEECIKGVLVGVCVFYRDPSLLAEEPGLVSEIPMHFATVTINCSQTLYIYIYLPSISYKLHKHHPLPFNTPLL